MSDRVVDLHTHFYTDGYLKAVEAAPSTDVYRREDGRFVCRWHGGVALTVPQPHPGVAQRLEMMDELGITMQVLSVPSPNAYFLPAAEGRTLADTVNEEFAEICRENPDRFSWLAMVPMQDVGEAIAAADHAIDQLGAKGLHLLTNVNGTYLDEPIFEPFWEYANSRELLVYLHPTVPECQAYEPHALAIAMGFFADTNLSVARLAYSGVFARYPAIRWVISHLGGTLPFMLPRLDSYWRQFPAANERCPEPPTSYIKSLVFDTASSHRPALICACETFGQERLVFGTDHPHVPGGSGPYLEALEVLALTGEQRSALLHGRADRLLAGERV
ncbi:amidohydrolase [Mycolicibacterium agri]|uniref:Amidohydrolase n=1 Tax=Mycolicibacterium agri TaxID=36811 RepID=A0A2A7NBI5_MYCAG|nr:amidohydrolase family protein [Mycolicibacterium agri]PEG41206.1 amidohydrolase [Mycolicibacterium agri]GFG55347.1 amidohydrolase [Mycolicibacterium agri]